MPLTTSAQLLPALKALVDPRAALAAGEVDPVVYLLEQAGARFGYGFELERYGPFSEALAAELVELTPEDLDDAGELDAELKAPVEIVHGIIEPEFPAIGRFTWIRLLAWVHFLRTYSGLELSNGDRPPYLQPPAFEQNVVDEAVKRVGALTPG